VKEAVPIVRILGIPFSVMGMDETVSYCEDLIRTGNAHHVITANPEIVMLARKDEGLRNIIEGAQLVTCDGTGIVWASKYTDFSAKERVAGFDLTMRLLNLSAERGFSVYFVGAKPEIIKKAVENLQELLPALQVAGYHHGYFRAGDEQKICDDIQDKQPTILFVAMGAPKQEFWIAEHLPQLNVSLALGIGGSLDVLAGAVKRAPLFWQKVRLEWLYRFIKQPSRWKRMLVLPEFVYRVLKDQKGGAKISKS